MRFTGTLLISLGIIALLLWAEHLFTTHRRAREDEVLKESFLTRMIMPNSNLGKAPTREGIGRWSNQCKLGALWIQWIIPTLGLLSGLSGLALIILASGRASRDS